MYVTAHASSTTKSVLLSQ